MEINELSKKAMGGTELMLDRLHSSIDPDILNEFQIIPTRVRELDESRYRILWIHDTCDDPETYHLNNGGYNKFHKLVFVSYYQMYSFIRKYNIPFSKCTVIENGITPIEITSKELYDKFQTNEIRMIYTSTPHRGLEILVPVFNEIKTEYPYIHLDVFSSFSLYGWPERDKQYESLLNTCKNSERIHYYGSQPNTVVRQHLKQSNLFVYPSIWEETSCLCLIEAMSAGCVSIHSSLGALPETSLKLNCMYDYDEDLSRHRDRFKAKLCEFLDNFQSNRTLAISTAEVARANANDLYDWSKLSKKWKALLISILKESPIKEITKARFVYRT